MIARKHLVSLIVPLLSMTDLAFGSGVWGDGYTLELTAGEKVSEALDLSDNQRQANTRQLSGMFFPTVWVGTGFSGRFVEYDPRTLASGLKSESGYELLWDLKFRTPGLRFLGLNSSVFVKAGVVLASDYDAQALAESDSERYQLRTSNEEASYAIRHKLQGYRTAVGVESVWQQSLWQVKPGLVAEWARGEEKWVQRKYYYQGSRRSLAREDKPTTYDEFLIGLHFRQ